MNKTIKKILLVVAGAFVGAVNGLLGGGGGMIAVPTLALFGYETKTAHATAILVILPISIASAVVYMLHGQLSLWQTLSCGGGVVLGGILGAVLLSKLNSSLVRILFALLMVAVGIRQMIG